jgi:predicted CoA-binding protein
MIEKKIDTITLYVNPDLLKNYIDEIIRIKPRRVIFNPGTEISEIEEIFEKQGIQTIEACTLVMLRTGQF